VLKPVRRVQPVTTNLSTPITEPTITAGVAGTILAAPALPVVVTAASRTLDAESAPASGIAAVSKAGSVDIGPASDTSSVLARTVAPVGGTPSDAGAALSLVATATTSGSSFVPGTAAGAGGATFILDETYRQLHMTSVSGAVSGTLALPSEGMMAERSMLWPLEAALIELDLLQRPDSECAPIEE
jgi:hypothetical protein